MEDMQYYQQLIQQGYPPMTAAQYTKQYFPEFQDPILNPSLFISPDANIGEKSSRKSIFIASILILGLVGIGGFFLYDDAAEPSFFGEIYWGESEIAIIFEEDGFSLGQPLVNGSCDFFQDKAEENGDEIKKSNGVCKSYFEMDDEYTYENKGDFYEICFSRRPSDCSGMYIFERGMIVNNQGVCAVRVSDINPPPSLYDIHETSNESDSLSYKWVAEYEQGVESWLEDWYEVAGEIMDDDDAPSCFYDFMNDGYDSPSGGLDIYIFRDRDVRTTMSSEGEEGLVYVQMVQSEGDGISRDLLSVSIIVDGGASLTCQKFTQEWDEEYDEYAECTWSVADGDGDDWEVYDEIIISEGPNTNLCDGSNGGCTVDITLTKIGIGGEDNRIIAEISSYASAN
jgi:hypothetical protein